MLPERPSNALQKAVFWRPKDGLLQYVDYQAVTRQPPDALPGGLTDVPEHMPM